MIDLTETWKKMNDEYFDPWDWIRFLAKKSNAYALPTIFDHFYHVCCTDKDKIPDYDPDDWQWCSGDLCEFMKSHYPLELKTSVDDWYEWSTSLEEEI